MVINSLRDFKVIDLFSLWRLVRLSGTFKLKGFTNLLKTFTGLLLNFFFHHVSAKVVYYLLLATICLRIVHLEEIMTKVELVLYILNLLSFLDSLLNEVES